jgi:hypothetical protein
MIASSIIDKDYIQYGFAGFAFVLLGVVIWLIVVMLKNGKDQSDKLVGVIEKSNSISAKLIDAIKSLGLKEEHAKESMDMFRTETQASFKDIEGKIDDLREKILARPCMKNRSTQS